MRVDTVLIEMLLVDRNFIAGKLNYYQKSGFIFLAMAWLLRRDKSVAKPKVSHVIMSSEERMSKSINESWTKLTLKLIWGLIKLVGMSAGILFLSAGAMLYTLHWIYGTTIRNPRLPQLMVAGLVLQACCTYAYPSWVGKLKAFRNLLLYSMGMVFPFSLGCGLFILVTSKKITFGLLEVSILIACGVLYYLAYSFLKARNALIHRTGSVLRRSREREKKNERNSLEHKGDER